MCIIAGGRKVLDGSLREVRRSNRGAHYAVEFDEQAAAAEAFFRANGRFHQVTRQGDGWLVELAPGADARELLARLEELEVPLTRFEHVQPSLHEIFVAHVGGATTPHRRPEPAHV